MPRLVDMVPNDWIPYMDGNIWEFTMEEWREMYPFHPMTNQVDCTIIGMRQVTWVRGNCMYSRFFPGDHALTDKDIAGM